MGRSHLLIDQREAWERSASDLMMMKSEVVEAHARVALIQNTYNSLVRGSEDGCRIDGCCTTQECEKGLLPLHRRAREGGRRGPSHDLRGGAGRSNQGGETHGLSAR
jgi:hypothetical protein